MIEEAPNQVFFGAGSGITPLMSMIKSALKVSDSSKVFLLFGCRDEENIIFKKELDALLTQFSERLKVSYVLSQSKGAWQGLKGRINQTITTDQLKDWGFDFSEAQYYMCGPEAMMSNIQEVLKDLNIPSDNVH